MLTDLDRELERRGHAFARYADDCNVDLGSRTAAEHAFETAKRYLESELKLQVNPDKSGVARASARDFLGYRLIGRETARLKVAKASIQRLRGRVKDVLRKSRGVSVLAAIEALNPLLRGWTSYFRHAQVKDVCQDLDGWVRRKLRGRLWRQGKRPLARARMLMKRGLTEERAWRSPGDQRARCLVERRGQPHERRVPEVVLRPYGAGVAGGYPPALPQSIMNRRMRNRTYGGVGGRRG
jgi:RNA-directed DNA polymerase